MATYFINTSAGFQSILNTYNDGDIIRLSPQVSFIGPFVVKNRGALSQGLIIRADTDDANLPPAGVRINATYDQYMPVVRSTQLSNYQNESAISFQAGANNVTILGLKFLSQYVGGGEILQIGINDSAFQQFDSQFPYNVFVDRCVFVGGDQWGQKRGVGCNGNNVQVINCDFRNFWSYGQDSQCFACFNSRGPIVWRNNKCEGATYPFMIGGSDPQVYTTAQVATSPAPTTSSARLEAFRSGHTIATLRLGQLVAFKVSGGTNRKFGYVTSINTSTNDIQFTAIHPDEPINVAPDSGAGSQMAWGAIPDNITIEHNLFTRRPEWRNGIIQAPINVIASPSAGGGTLAAGTYKYTVQAVINNGYGAQTHYSAESAEVSVVLGGTGKAIIGWQAVSNAESYRINGRSTTKDRFWTVSAGTTTFEDTGTSGSLASPPAATKGRWKNLGEIKFGTNGVWRYNIHENTWTGSDSGYFAWFKSVNQENTTPFAQTKNWTIEYNLFRHSAGVWLFSSGEGSGGFVNYPPPMENITLRHNLAYDSRSFWSDDGTTVRGVFITGNRPIINLILEHNTFIHNMNAAVYMDGGALKGTNKFRNNIWRKGLYGIGGSGGVFEGSSALTGFNISEFVGNVVEGANSANYPANNTFPNSATFEAAFTDYDSGIDGDYSLPPGSPFLTSGVTEDSGLTSTLGALTLSATGTVSGAATGDIVWTNVSATASASGNDISRVSGQEDTPNASGISQQSLTGDGYFEFTVPQIEFAQIGLGNDTSSSIDTMEHCLRFQTDAQVSIRYGTGTGTNYHGETNYSAGDVFRFTRSGTTITATRNGSALTPSPAWPASSGSVKLDVSIWTIGGGFNDATIG